MRLTPTSTTAVQSTDAGLAKLHVCLSRACQGFEAIFIRQMLATARSTSVGEGILGGDSASQITDSMRNDALADTISGGGGIGVADVLERQLWPAVRAQESAKGKVPREG
jgi:flagellar protein FlgJ